MKFKITLKSTKLFFCVKMMIIHDSENSDHFDVQKVFRIVAKEDDISKCIPIPISRL